MGAPQAIVFRQIRDGQDPQADLGWSSQVARKIVRMSPSAPEDVESLFDLTESERVLWWLLKLPRRYLDLENAGVLPPDVARRVLRALVSADVVVLVEGESPKPIIPVEVVRLKKKAKGIAVEKATTGKLQARVYRPDIGIGGAPSGSASVSEAAAPAVAAPVSSARTGSANSAASPRGAAVPPPVEIATQPPPPTPRASVPPTSPRPVLDESAQALQARIEARYEKLKSQNHYQVLELTQSAAAADIKKAYFVFVKDYHPDVIAGTSLTEDPKLVKKINAIFQRVQEAHRVLSKDEDRKHYDDLLRTDPNAGNLSTANGKTRRPEEARMLATKAHHLLKAKEYATAERTYLQAHDFDSQNLEIRLGLAWCMYLNEARPKAERVAAAREKLEVLVQSGVAEAAWKLASIARAENDNEGFARYVTQTLRMNPRHVDALREQRLVQMRREKQEQATQKPQSFLDKFKRR